MYAMIYQNHIIFYICYHFMLNRVCSAVYSRRRDANYLGHNRIVFEITQISSRFNLSWLTGSL